WLVERVHEPVGDDRGAVGLADRQPPGRLQLALPRLDLLRAGAVAVGAEELRPVGGGEGEGEGERECGRGQEVRHGANSVAGFTRRATAPARGGGERVRAGSWYSCPRPAAARPRSGRRAAGRTASRCRASRRSA